jgi:hypothetical protein
MTEANLKALHPHSSFCFKVASSKDLDVPATTTTIVMVNENLVLFDLHLMIA